MLFCDVASAFYKVLQELAIGATCSDADLARIAHRLGLGPEVMPVLHKALKGTTAYQQMGATKHQQTLLHESLQQTWFTYDGQTCIQTHRGTRPGDSWVDIVFNILFAHVLQKVQRQLEDNQMITIVPATAYAAQEAPFWQATWADDLAILLAFHTVEDLVQKFPIAVNALLDVLREFGMQASLGDTKTAAIIQPRGKGAVAVRRRLFARNPATWPIMTEHEVVQLPLVSQYKHLGGLVTAAGTMTNEIRARVSKAKSSFWRIAHKVLRNEHFPLQTRAKIFQATVLSVLTWGSGAWPMLNVGEHKLWVTAYWELLRKIMPKKCRQLLHLSHAQILSTLELEHPDDALRAQRARHFGLMLTAGPPTLCELAKLDSKAYTAIKQAVQWVWNYIGRDEGLPPTERWTPWIEYIQKSPHQWEKLVHRVQERSRRMRNRDGKVEIWHRRILEAIQTLISNDPQAARHAGHPCLICRVSFATKKAWFLHAHHKHEYRTMHGEATIGTKCTVCAKEYFHSSKLHNHLRYSSLCRNTMWHQVHIQQAGCSTLAHPQRPWQQERDPVQPDYQAEDRDLSDLHNRLEDTLHSGMFQVDSHDFLHELEAALQQTCIIAMPYDTIVEGFRRWAGSYQCSTDRVLLQAIANTATWLLEYPATWECATTDTSYPELSNEKERLHYRFHAAKKISKSLPMPKGNCFSSLFQWTQKARRSSDAVGTAPRP